MGLQVGSPDIGPAIAGDARIFSRQTTGSVPRPKPGQGGEGGMPYRTEPFYKALEWEYS